MASNPLQDYADLSDLYVQNERMTREFDANTEFIGNGTFGQVFKAQHLIDQKEYAIKTIIIKEGNLVKGTVRELYDLTIKELKVWAKLDCDHFTQYRSSWLEAGHKNKELVLTVHVQMDLCWFTLEGAIHKMRTHFDRQVNQFLPTLGYYMASELLIEILEGIDYLHNSRPPIMHRDIKPKNILIKGSPYGRFIKLADFGLATEHLKESMTHTQAMGTDKYMPPEVRLSRYYGTKADMYSIGVTVHELFNFDLYSPQPKDDNYVKITTLNKTLLDGFPSNRPSCADTLKARH
ncbi:unnamed protein product, partial [Oppiella nova]